MIQTLQEGRNHKDFRELALGVRQSHISWLQGTLNAGSYPRANTEGSNRGRRALCLLLPWTSGCLEPLRWAQRYVLL